jgi:hypothetical protein
MNNDGDFVDVIVLYTSLPLSLIGFPLCNLVRVGQRTKDLSHERLC